MKDIYNYLRLTEKLSTSGMPKPTQLSGIAEGGVKFVVNLATPKSEGWIPNEGELLKRLGVEYLSILVDWENPQPKDLSIFMDAMDEHKGQSIHVHCQANYRATAFVTLYRIKRLGWKNEDAFTDMHKIWNPETYPVWKKFIEDSLNVT